MKWTRLKIYIRKNRISQRELAGKIGMSEKTLSDKLNKNNMTLDELETICKELGVPASMFLTDYSADKMIEVSELEREIIRLIRDMPDDRKEKILNVIKEIQGM